MVLMLIEAPSGSKFKMTVHVKGNSRDGSASNSQSW